MTRFAAPTQDFKNLQQQLNRLFEPFARFTPTDEDLVAGNWAPPVDVAETQEKILVRAELPGLKQEGLTWHRVERTYGAFSRSFTLPRTVDPEKIAATYREGILEIEVPKREEAKPKQIRIAVK